jgi:hypothetical protein
MPGFLTPETDNTLFADFDRRLRALETTQRVGISRTRSAQSTYDDYPSTYDEWDSTGGALREWRDDQGNEGGGYPTVTLIAGTRVLVLLSAKVGGYAAGGGFRSYQGQLGVGIDGGTPADHVGDVFGWRMGVYNATVSELQHPTAIAIVKEVTPGEHEFAVWSWWSDNAGSGTQPLWSSVQLTVIPLD